MSSVAATCAALDLVYRAHPAEMIEEAIQPYRPVLSHAVVHHFRHNLWEHVIYRSGFQGWMDALPDDPVVEVPPLDTIQLTLLGGWRPTHTVHDVVSRLAARIDNGDRGDLSVVSRILGPSFTAVDSLATHAEVTAVKSAEEAEKLMREFMELAVAAQYAAMVAALTGERSRLSAEEDPRFVPRYFLAALQAFQRVALSRADQTAFSDFYLSGARIRDIAEETGAKLKVLIDRRRAFLQRLSLGLRSVIAVIAQEAAPEGSRPPWPALPPPVAPEIPPEPPPALPAKKRTRSVSGGASPRRKR